MRFWVALGVLVAVAALFIVGRPVPAQQQAPQQGTAQERLPPKVEFPKPPAELLKRVRDFASGQPLKVGADEDPVRRLRAERYNIALRVLGEDLRAVEANQAPITVLAASFHTFRITKQELGNANDLVAMLETEVELARAEEQVLSVLVKANRLAPRDLEMARFARLGIEIELLQAKKGTPAPARAQ